MSLAEKKIIFTYEDLLHWEDDRMRHELVEGEHFMTPSPNLYHQKISINLTWHLKKYVDDNETGIVLSAPVDIKLSDIDVLVPDIFYVEQKRVHLLEGNYFSEAPKLVIEILSPSTAKRDKNIKFKRYSVYGVKEYWIVDPKTHSVDVFDLEKQELIASFCDNDQLNTPTFPDINLPLKNVF